MSGAEQVTTRVRRVTEYASFAEMLDHEDARSIGGELGESRESCSASSAMSVRRSKDRLGGLAIEVERIV